jgi:hypothetical protein
MLKFLSSFIFILPLIGIAQKNINEHRLGWALYIGTHKITDKVKFMTEYQWRRAEGFKQWQQSLLRLGLEYEINPKVSVMCGYAWVRSFPYGNQPVLHEFDEHRVFEQLNLNDKVGRFEIQHRYRLEQRLLDQYAKNATNDIVQVDPVYRNRIRYRAMIMVPLTRKEMGDNTLFLNVNNELFVGFGKGIAKNPIDQNRFITALGWRFNAQTNIQVGYLNQFVIKPNAMDMERNHALWISMGYNLDFTKMFDKK